VDLSSANKTSPEEYQLLIEGDRRPIRGDIIYTRNVLIGAAAVVDTDDEFCMGQDVSLIRPRRENSWYLAYQLRSSGVLSQLESFLVGSTFRHINVTEISNLMLYFPPKKEQDAIVNMIRQRSGAINNAITQAEGQIALLREYRTRLIADVLTGKVNVRDVAFRLPAEFDNLEPWDEVDEVDGEEEIEALEGAKIE
jgi:type I restriction enzyme S subunit